MQMRFILREQFVVFEGCATGGFVPLEEAVLSNPDPLVLYRNNLAGIADLSNTIYQFAANSAEDFEYPPTSDTDDVVVCILYISVATVNGAHKM